MKLAPSVVLALFAVACRPPPVAQAGAELTIGVVLPLTGREAAYGVPCRSGIELAILEHNKESKRPLKAVYMDDQSNREDAALLAQRLVSRERVQVLIGEVSTSASLAMVPVADRARTPMISPAATSAELSEASEWAFRIAFDDAAQATAMARYAHQTLKLERVAVLRDLSSQYSVGLAQAFERAFATAGGHITASEAFDRNDATLEPIIATLLKSGATALYLPVYHPEVARVVSAGAKLFPPSFVLLGADGWDTREIVALGAAVEGSYFTGHFAADDPRKEVAAFVASFEDRYNESPDATAALGYDAVRFLSSALERTGSAERTRLRETLAAPIGFDGVTGSFQLDEKRKPMKAPVLIKIQDGKRVFVAHDAEP